MQRAPDLGLARRPFEGRHRGGGIAELRASTGDVELELGDVTLAVCEQALAGAQDQIGILEAPSRGLQEIQTTLITRPDVERSLGHDTCTLEVGAANQHLGELAGRLEERVIVVCEQLPGPDPVAERRLLVARFLADLRQGEQGRHVVRLEAQDRGVQLSDVVASFGLALEQRQQAVDDVDRVVDGGRLVIDALERDREPLTQQALELLPTPGVGERIFELVGDLLVVRAKLARGCQHLDAVHVLAQLGSTYEPSGLSVTVGLLDRFEGEGRGSLALAELGQQVEDQLGELQSRGGIALAKVPCTFEILGRLGRLAGIEKQSCTALGHVGRLCVEAIEIGCIEECGVAFERRAGAAGVIERAGESEGQRARGRELVGTCELLDPLRELAAIDEDLARACTGAGLGRRGVG